MSDENEQHENDSQADASNADETVDFEPLTATYERLRHSTDSAALWYRMLQISSRTNFRIVQ